LPLPYDIQMLKSFQLQRGFVHVTADQRLCPCTCWVLCLQTPIIDSHFTLTMVPHSSALPLQTSRTITVSDTANTYTVIHKKWQYICDHNTVKSTNGNECPLQVSYLLIYFTCDVNMTSLSLMSCNSICCMCGEARSSC